MAFKNSSGVRYFSFDSFPENISHAVFTRQGGVSGFPWGTLNVGGTVGDAPENVLENRVRSFHAMNRDPKSIFDVWQIHSADVIVATEPNKVNAPDIKADAIITNKVGVTLFMRYADCVPILLYDPLKNAIGIVHSGWQGTVKKVISATVKEMQNNFDCEPKDILAGIGPSIGPDHYEVGEDVINHVYESFSKSANDLLIKKDSRVFFDLWNANKIALQEIGVTKIEIAELCTACHTEDWYSHRAEKGKTGRFGALIGLKSDYS